MDTKELMNNCSRARIITVKTILFPGFCGQNVTVIRRFSCVESTVIYAMLKQAMDVGTDLSGAQDDLCHSVLSQFSGEM